MRIGVIRALRRRIAILGSPNPEGETAIFPRSPARAFTLIEIMVVIVILAIIAGGVVPIIGRNRHNEQLEHAAAQLGESLRWLYSAAVTEGVRYQWTWDEDFGGWRYFKESDPVERPGEFAPTLVAGRSGESLPSGLSLEGIYFAVRRDEANESSDALVAPVVNFHPTGYCDSVFVVLQAGAVDDGSAGTPEALTVALNGITGRVKTLAGNAMADAEQDQEAQPEASTLLMGQAPPPEDAL